VSVFCDLIGKRVLFAAPGKDKSTWAAFVEALGAHNGHPRAITEVSIDMSPAYIAGVMENIGDQAIIVFDKFPVIMHANAAVDETRRAEALRHRGMAELFLGETDAARVSIAEALDAARVGGDRATEAWALQNLAWIAYSGGDAEEADRHLQSSIELFQDIGDRGGLGWALGLLAWVRFHQGKRDEAEALAQKVLPDIDRRSDRWGQGMMSLLVACARLWSGRAGSAIVPAQEAATAFEEIDDRWGRVQAVAAEGRSAVAMGEIERGLALFDDALEVTLSDSDHRGSAAVVGAAHSAIAVGDPDRAETLLARWPDVELNPKAIGDREIGVARGLVALQRAQVPDALRLLGAAAGEGRDEGGPPARAALALAVAADGRHAEAAALAQPVADSPDAATYLDRAHALLALGLAAAAAGEREACDAWFSRARREIDDTDDVLTQAVVRLGLAQALRHLGSEGAVWAQADADTRFAPMGVDAAGWSRLFALIAPDATTDVPTSDADGPAQEGRPVSSS